MRYKATVTYTFKEELVGDEANNKDFYLRLTPVIKFSPAHENRPTKEDRDAIAKAILSELKKKGPIT